MADRNWLENIEDTEQHDPPRIILFGDAGVGKTTWAASAPSPIFIAPEQGGLSRIKAKHFGGVETYENAFDCIETLCERDHDFKTIAIDSLDWLELMLFDKLCRRDQVKSILEVAGGWQNGYLVAVEEWKKLTPMLDYLNHEKQMYVICVAHTMIQNIKSPLYKEAYDRIQMKLNPKATAYFVEWADIVMYAHRKMTLVKRDPKKSTPHNLIQGIGSKDGDRVMETLGSPALLCKRRINIPDEIPLDWDIFEKLVKENDN